MGLLGRPMGLLGRPIGLLGRPMGLLSSTGLVVFSVNFCYRTMPGQLYPASTISSTPHRVSEE